jgi:hypothetical protein
MMRAARRLDGTTGRNELPFNIVSYIFDRAPILAYDQPVKLVSERSLKAMPALPASFAWRLAFWD